MRPTAHTLLSSFAALIQSYNISIHLVPTVCKIFFSFFILESITINYSQRSYYSYPDIRLSDLIHCPRKNCWIKCMRNTMAAESRCHQALHSASAFILTQEKKIQRSTKTYIIFSQNILHSSPKINK